MPLIIMPGGRSGGKSGPENAWTQYMDYVFPEYQADFIDRNREKLGQLELEFRLSMFDCMIGERKSEVLRDRVRDAQEIVMENRPYIEIKLDRKLEEDEMQAFPDHFVSVICYHYDASALDFSHKKIRNGKNELLGYRIYYKGKFVHAMTFAEEQILLDNLEMSPTLSYHYIEALREGAGL